MPNFAGVVDILETSPGTRHMQPILVTGSHRSGSTWVGSTLAADPSLVYIEEPFNVHNPSPGVCACRFPCPFFRIDDSTADLYAPDSARMMALRFRYRDLLTSAPYPLSTLKRSLRGAQALLVGRTRGSVPLLKDPLALFSAEWLAERFGTRVLVLIRHPAAFAASLLRLNWRFNFVHFTDQKALLEGDLAPLASDLRAAEQTRLPPIREAALLWKCLHVVIRRYMVDHADWTFLRLEDIASDPVLCFRNLAEVFALSRPDLVIERALLTSNASNPTSAPPGAVHSLFRNSKAASIAWRSRLTSTDRDCLRAEVGELASTFYPGESW